MTNFMNNQCLSSLIQGPTSEAVVQICSVKKVFLEISQNSQENTCIRVSFLIERGRGDDFFQGGLQFLHKEIKI